MVDVSWCVHYQLSLEITNNGVPHNDQAMTRQMSIGCIMESPSLPREDNQGSVRLSAVSDAVALWSGFVFIPSPLLASWPVSCYSAK